MLPLIILTGPTTSGKSETAQALAESLGTEIINADSMQVYKYFDIGTAKPPREIRERIPHHLIDILEPDQEFNAFDFKVRALEHIRELIGRGKVPLVVGGTGLYIKVLTEDYDCAAPISPETRRTLQGEIRKNGLAFLHEELKRIDPAAAENIMPTDSTRIERALGVYRETGKRFSEYHAEESQPRHSFPIKTFLLQGNRRDLYENIDRRVTAMIEKGLVDEVRNLLHRGTPKTAKPFQSIGYAQIMDYLEGKLSLERAVYEIQRETRHYAKRQITWFKKVPNTIPIYTHPRDTAATLRNKILGFLPKFAALLFLLLFSLGNPAFGGAADSRYFQDGVTAFSKSRYAEAENRLRAILNAHLNTPQGKRALYLMGQIHARQNKPGLAVEFFEKALKAYPEIEDYIRFSLAKGWADSHREEPALEQLDRLIERFPQTLTYPRVQLLRAGLLHKVGQTRKAVEVLRQTVDRISREESAAGFNSFLPELIYKQARLERELGLNGATYTLFRKLYIHYPSHPLTKQALPEIQQLRFLPDVPPAPLTLEERSLRIRNLFHDRRYGQVIQEIREMEPHLSHLPEPIYFYLARANRGLRQRADANQVLESFVKQFPAHPRAAEARFRIGRNLWNLGRDSAAVQELKKILKNGNSPQWTIRARYILGRIHEGNKQYTRALDYFGGLIEKYRNTRTAQRAAWRMGWIHYLTGNYERAFQRFHENTDLYPDGILIESNWYWQAKAAEKLRKGPASREIYRKIIENYPYTYYGIRAREKLEALGIRVSETPANSSPGTITEWEKKEDSIRGPGRVLTPGEKFHYGRAVEMTRMGLYENAKREIQSLEATVGTTPAGVIWLSGLYHRANSYAESVRLLIQYKSGLTRKEEKGLSKKFWKYFFPPAYADLIRTNSRAYHIDPFLVRGLIHQESLFDTDSLSSAGARGLMQIMPETGKRLYASGKYGKPFKTDALNDPHLNIELGVKYLSGLYRRYGDNGAHVLISYNAGPRVLNKWLKRFRHVDDPDVFIESIPYPETRNYVKKVLRNYGIYRILYPDDSRAPSP